MHWSGNGKLVSSGGRIAGGPSLPATELLWAPTGETAAYVTPRGEVARGIPFPAGSDPGGRLLWWQWPNSGSIASDGVALFAGRSKLGTMLMYPDWLVACGRGLAFAAGVDRNSLTGKSIVVDGRDVSRDPSRSWVSPACSVDGRVVVASSSPASDGPWGREHRALWQLLPALKQLTRPPRGWTDESPAILRDGSILFVRTHETARKVDDTWIATDHAVLEQLRGGVVTRLASLTYSANELSGQFTQFYGHYAWPTRVAVRP